jgi:membrane protein YqaA with SNARE-associated domain
MEIEQHNYNELPVPGCPILSPSWPEDRTYHPEPFDLSDDEEWRQPIWARNVEFMFALALGLAVWTAVIVWAAGWL